MTLLKVKSTEASLDCDHKAIAFHGSFVAEPNQFSEEDSYGMVDSWICIEDETEVLNAVCEDKIEELNKNAKPAADNDTEDDVEPDLQKMDIDSDEPNFFSYVEAVELLGKLQRSAPKLAVNAAATVHLDRFLKALHAGNAKKPRKTTTLHAFWPTKYPIR